MKVLVHTFETLGHFQSEHFHRARLFKAEKITDKMYGGGKDKYENEILAIDKGNKIDNRVKYEIGEAYAHYHGWAG